MSWRLRFYKWLKEGPAATLRWLGLNALLFFGLGALVTVIDLALGSLEWRWGLDVWFGFVVGFSGVVVFNVALELMGMDYRREQSRTDTQQDMHAT